MEQQPTTLTTDFRNPAHFREGTIRSFFPLYFRGTGTQGLARGFKLPKPLFTMKRFALLFAAALVFAGTASAANLQVEEISIEDDLHGGEQIQKEIVLSWSGETDTVAHLTPIIEAEDTDSEGLKVTYSENPVIVPENEKARVTMSVSADYYIKPDNFTIGTEAVTSVDKETETDVRYREEETTVVRTVPEGSLNESEEEELQEAVNRSLKENRRLEDKIARMYQDIKELTQDSNESGQGNESSNFEPGGNEKQDSSIISKLFEFLFGWL